MNINRILQEIEMYKTLIQDYENNPNYIELLCELENIKLLSYYEKTKLENLEKMNNTLLSIKLSLDKLTFNK